MEQEKRILIRKQFEMSSNKDKKNVILYLLDMGYDNKELTEILGVNVKKIYNIKKRRKLFKMNDTVIYLIRHADTVEENGIRNTNENSQMINEKETRKPSKIKGFRVSGDYSHSLPKG